jgi:hypothetical protein
LSIIPFLRSPDTDEMHRQSVLFGKRHQDAAPRRAVELGHRKAGDAGSTVKCFDLR